MYKQYNNLMQQDQLRVQDTNEQALSSKLSAIKKGYFHDPYAEEFTQYRGKRDIIIHRGYWARVYIIRRLIESMLAQKEAVQIVSLGCGLQTMWFNLVESKHDLTKFKFLQLDLESVVRKKIKKIKHSKKITALLQKLEINTHVDQHHNQFSASNYLLTACDLSKLSQFQHLLSQQRLDPSVPTFFYSQCVLSYIDADRVDELMTFIHQQFDFAFIFDYEMYNPHDRFGQMMVKNFAIRGCPLIGINKYPLLENQRLRYESANFQETEVFTMQQIYYDCIDKHERIKIEKIEMLDELQEWNLIMSHYFALLSLTYNEKGRQHAAFEILCQTVKLKLQ